MVSGGGQIDRDGGQIDRGLTLFAGEEFERQRWISNAAHIRGSYRYMRHGLQPMPVFKRRESLHYWQLKSLGSGCLSSASSAPPHCLNLGEAASSRVVDGEATSSRGPPAVPQFDPSDYTDDDDIEKLAAELERKAPTLTAGDFIPASALGTVTALLEEKTHRDADKAEKWRREQEDAKYESECSAQGSPPRPETPVRYLRLNFGSQLPRRRHFS